MTFLITNVAPQKTIRKSLKCLSIAQPIVFLNKEYAYLGWHEEVSDDIVLIMETTPNPTKKEIDYVSKIKKILLNKPTTEAECLNLADRIKTLRTTLQSVNSEGIIQPRFEQQAAMRAYNVSLTVLHSLLDGGDLRHGPKNRKMMVVRNQSERLRLTKLWWATVVLWTNEIGCKLPVFEE